MSNTKISNNIMKKCKIKKGDEVIVVAGRDKGKISRVTQVLYSKGKVKLDGLNLVKCFNKKKKTLLMQGDTKSMPMHVSNVSHIDPKTRKATRTCIIIKDGIKFLTAKKSGETIREISRKENSNA